MDHGFDDDPRDARSRVRHAVRGSGAHFAGVAAALVLSAAGAATTLDAHSGTESADVRSNADDANATFEAEVAAWPSADARAIVGYWRDGGPALWFGKDPVLDARFRERFLAVHERASRGELDGWARTADGALALLILLDQFPRNAFRDTPRMYATDARALAVADAAIAAGHDRAVAPELQVFFYLPFAHSERLADQDRAVALATRLGPPHSERARHHREIIARFGRFPHRNAILGRPETVAERRYLDAGGYRG